MSRGGVLRRLVGRFGVADEKVGVSIENLLFELSANLHILRISHRFLPCFLTGRTTDNHAPSLYLVRNAGPPKQNKSALTLSAAAARP